MERKLPRIVGEILADAALGEDVAGGREAVAAVRHRLNGVAVGLQGFDRLPDRVSAHAEAAGDLLTGEKDALVGFEERAKVVLYGHGNLLRG